MSAACIALDYPVVSGNVSLYNETNGQGIYPTPTIGGVGLIEDAAQSVGIAFTGNNHDIILVGETRGHLGCSLYLNLIEGRSDGAPPPVNLSIERKNGEFVRAQILSNMISACHDLSDGGLLVALTEMALAGNIGATVNALNVTIPFHAWGFGEDQARYLVTSSKAEELLSRAKKADVLAQIIGKTGGAAIKINGIGSLEVAEIKRIHEHWMPTYMG